MKNKEYTYDYKIDFQSRTTATIILKGVKENSKVLELGPSTGYMTKYLSEELKCEVTCIEIDEESSEIAKQYCKKMIVGNLDKLNLEEVLQEKYDYVLMADVLEHLFSPKDALEQIRKILKPDGILWLSIPNVSHISIIQQLVENKFSYGKWGLLDNTHVRFFTRTTIKNLLHELKYEVIGEENIIKYPEETEFESDNLEIDFFNNIIKERNADLYTYQMIFKLRLTEDDDNYLNKKNINISYKRQFESKLYIDLGDGFNEKETSTATCNYLNGKFYVKFKLFDHIEKNHARNIRLDLLENKFSYIKIVGASFRDNKNIIQNMKLNNISNNADLVKEDNGMYFFTYDPQIYFNLDNIYLKDITIWGECKIEDDLEVTKYLYEFTKNAEKRLEELQLSLAKTRDMKDQLIGSLNSRIEDKDKKIEEQNQLMINLEKNIEDKNEILKSRDIEISSLNNQIEKLKIEIKDKHERIQRHNKMSLVKRILNKI